MNSSKPPGRGAGTKSMLRIILILLGLPFIFCLYLNMLQGPNPVSYWGDKEPVIASVSTLGTPSDQNPQHPYDPNWKLTAYASDADSARAKADCNCLSARLGDGYTVTCFNTEKDMQCKMGLCHKPLTYIIEHPGRDNEARTQDSKQGTYLDCNQMEAWMHKTVDDYNRHVMWIFERRRKQAL